MKQETTVRFTREELRARRLSHGTGTDWSRVDNLTEVELAQLIASDVDDPANPDWRTLDREVILLELSPELLGVLPPPGPVRNAEVSRILRSYLKRKVDRRRKAG